MIASDAHTGMAAQTHEWPEAVAGAPAVSVFDRALESNRLGHALLLHGENLGLLEQVGLSLAARLLGSSSAVESHPDFHALRPSGKARVITADNTRDLIGELQRTPQAGARKVAVLFEADRLHISAANIFLKTLEEPPGETTLILLSERPHSLLATIRSRCLHFRLPGTLEIPAHPDWPQWTRDYRTWIERLGAGVSGRTGAADRIFEMYGLVVRFSSILNEATAETLKNGDGATADNLSEEELEAIAAGLAVGLRQRMFADIERTTGTVLREHPDQAERLRPALIRAVTRLEESVALLRLHARPEVVLERFMLQSLRIWTGAPDR